MTEGQKYEFTSINGVLDFIKPLLIEGKYKIEAGTVLADSCIKRIDHYEVTVTLESKE